MLKIDTSHAHYPVTIDPFVQVGEGFGAAEAEKADFGSSIALTPDGKTAVIGATLANAAFIFTRSRTGWKQVRKLTPSAEDGTVVNFGFSVALSANGDTALVGATGETVFSAPGAGREAVASGEGAFVFTRFGASWRQVQMFSVQGGDGLGYSVALSADGKTALVGAPFEPNYELRTPRVGAAYVFSASGASWTRQSELKLVGQEVVEETELGAHAYLGSSVALSSDGDTALIGAGGFGRYKGAAFVFTRSGSTWTQQDGKLTGDGEEGEGAFGDSVALSANGKTAVIGAYQDDGHRGSAFVFARSGSTWTQQGEKLRGTGLEGYGAFGKTVAVSADGNAALIGAPLDASGHGAVWLFKRAGSRWTQQGAKLTATGQVGDADRARASRSRRTARAR